MSKAEGGLGAALVGEKIAINTVHVYVSKLIGEGGFAYVYLVKDIGDGSDAKNGDDGKKSKKTKDKSEKKDSGKGADAAAGVDGTDPKYMVLKVTSLGSKQQRDIAEKESKLLMKLSHPSIVKVFDSCYRTIPASTASTSAFGRKTDKAAHKEMTQHLILMEYCEGGHALGVCTALREQHSRFDLSTLIIAFGQICNAVSYLHAQRPPIIHRDLKPENFLIKSGAYKLCDFGSAVFGHVELKTSENRAEAEEEIQKTTTQMYRAPEMVDLFMAKRLTQATDVWALGCCLYSLAFLQNCFEEGSNLAILSRKYKIPDDNPYGDGLVELIDRMLTIDSKARADMTEVILCLSAVYSGRPLPPRKERSKKKKDGEKDDDGAADTKSTTGEKEKPKKSSNRSGSFRTDGQGIHAGDNLAIDPKSISQRKEVKKLDPNSAAARRRLAAAAGGGETLSNSNDFAAFDNHFDSSSAEIKKRTSSKSNSTDAEGAFDSMSLGGDNTERGGRSRRTETRDLTRRSRSKDVRRAPRRPSTKPAKSGDDDEQHTDNNDDDDDEQSLMPEQSTEQKPSDGTSTTPTTPGTGAKPVIKVIQSRGVRRTGSNASGNLSRARSRSRGAGLRRQGSEHKRGNGHDDEDDDDDDGE